MPLSRVHFPAACSGAAPATHPAEPSACAWQPFLVLRNPRHLLFFYRIFCPRPIRTPGKNSLHNCQAAPCFLAIFLRTPRSLPGMRPGRTAVSSVLFSGFPHDHTRFVPGGNHLAIPFPALTFDRRKCPVRSRRITPPMQKTCPGGQARSRRTPSAARIRAHPHRRMPRKRMQIPYALPPSRCLPLPVKAASTTLEPTRHR